MTTRDFFNMADKQSAKRKKKSSFKAADDLSLEDVVAAGGDKVGIICSLLFFLAQYVNNSGWIEHEFRRSFQNFSVILCISG